jgi:hypothetical protein
MTTTKKTARPRGRPPIDPAERKRRNFTFRVTDQLHDELSKAAAASGRSVSEEIEWRVSQSFSEQNLVASTVDAAFEKFLGQSAIPEEVMKRIARESAFDTVKLLLQYRTPSELFTAWSSEETIKTGEDQAAKTGEDR